MIYEGVVLSDSMLAADREKRTFDVYINWVVPLELERETKINSVHIIPLFPEFRDEDGEYGAGKIKNVFEAIFPFGDSQAPPRREPLETSWTRVRN